MRSSDEDPRHSCSKSHV